jgi:hypothetical protein
MTVLGIGPPSVVGVAGIRRPPQRAYRAGPGSAERIGDGTAGDAARIQAHPEAKTSMI